MLTLSDVTLALPRLMKFPPGEAGTAAKLISLNFIFETFREFVLAHQEPREEKIEQMCRRVTELDADFQVRLDVLLFVSHNSPSLTAVLSFVLKGVMESMDALETMLHSIQARQSKMLEHFKVYGDQSEEESPFDRNEANSLRIRRALSQSSYLLFVL